MKITLQWPENNAEYCGVRQPTWRRFGTFVAMCWPCTTWIFGASFPQLPPAPGRESGKSEFPPLMACKLLLLVMPWRRTGKQLQPFGSHWKVSSAGMTFPWPIAPIQPAPPRHICTWAAQWDVPCPLGTEVSARDEGWRYKIPTGAACLAPPVCEGPCNSLVFLSLCPHPITPSHKLLSLWKLDGRSTLSHRTSFVGKFHFAVPVWSLMKFLLMWYPALLHKVWASQGIFAISLTSVSWKSGRPWGATSLSPPHFWKYMKTEIFWAW